MHHETYKKSLVASLAKIAIVLSVFFLTEGIAVHRNPIAAYYRRGRVNKASCLSYGHACWGAHGKRSGPSSSNPRFNFLNSDLLNKNDDKEYESGKWFYNKLRDPLNRRYYRDTDYFDENKNKDDISMQNVLGGSLSSSDLKLQDFLKTDHAAQNQDDKSMERMFNSRFMEK